MKRFVFDRLVDRDNICNLQQVRSKINKHVKNKDNIIIYAPRNYGKTSLVKNIIFEDFRKKNKKSFIFFIDLMDVKSLDSITSRLKNAFECSFTESFPIKGAMRNALNLLSTLRPEIAFDAITGAPSISLRNINIHDKNKETLRYSILWLYPNKTRAHLEKPEEIPFKTMWIKDQEITIVDHMNDTIRNVEDMETIKSSQFQPILDFLSPLLLEERLQGQWIFKQFKHQEGHEWGIFDVINLEEGTRMEVTINMSTHLPVTIKKLVSDPTRTRGEGDIFINISFKWNAPIPLDLMVPKIQKGS